MAAATSGTPPVSADQMKQWIVQIQQIRDDEDAQIRGKKGKTAAQALAQNLDRFHSPNAVQKFSLEDMQVLQRLSGHSTFDTKQQAEYQQKFERFSARWQQHAPAKDRKAFTSWVKQVAKERVNKGDLSAEEQKELHKDFDDADAAKAKDAKRKDGTAGMDANPDTELYFKVLASLNKPETIAGMLSPFYEIHSGSNPEAVQQIEAIFAAETDVTKRLDALQKNEVCTDAIAIINKDPTKESKTLRKAIQGEAARRKKEAGSKKKLEDGRGVTPTEIRKELRDDILQGLEGANAGLMKTAEKALSIDLNSDVVKKLPEDKQKALADHNAKVEKIMAKMKEDPKSLTPDEVKTLLTTPDQIMGGAGASAGAGAGAAKPGDEMKLEGNFQQRRAALEKINPQLGVVVDSLRDAKSKYEIVADRSFNETVSLINSNLPIELVIMLVMTKIAEKHEENLKLKMKEAAAIEAFEKHNSQVTKAMESLTLEEQANPPPELQSLSPSDFGLPTQSSTIFMQEMQVHMQQYMQVMQALAAIIRQVQDLIMTPIRNIRQ